MRRSFALKASLIAFTSGCAPSAWGTRAQDRNVTITLVGAVLGPSKADGSYWDCCGNISPREAKQLIQLLDVATGPTAELFGILGSLLLKETSKPDPFGQAEFYLGERLMANVPLGKHSDTFQVTWQATSAHLDWNSGPRIKITLFDSDDILFKNDTPPDPIGTVWIDTSDLEPALVDGRVHNVSVAKQSNRQILFVAVTVTADGWTYVPTQDDESPLARCGNLVTHVINIAHAENALPEGQRSQALAQTQKCANSPPWETQYRCAMAANTVNDLISCGYRMDMLDAIQANR